MVSRHLTALDARECFKPFMLDSLTYIRAAWNSVTPKTVQNCWAVCMNRLSEAEDSEKQGEKGEVVMGLEDCSQLNIDTETFVQYVAVDENLNTHQPDTDDDIVEAIKSCQNTNVIQDLQEKEGEKEPFPPPVPSYAELSTCFSQLRAYVGNNPNLQHLEDTVSAMEFEIFKERLKNGKKQKTLDSYFKDLHS